MTVGSWSDIFFFLGIEGEKGDVKQICETKECVLKIETKASSRLYIELICAQIGLVNDKKCKCFNFTVGWLMHQGVCGDRSYCCHAIVGAYCGL